MMIGTRAVVVLMLVLLAACGGGSELDNDSNDGGTTIVLEFEGGALVGGARRETVSLGDTVVVRSVGAVDEQIHVHGYDLYLDPGSEADLRFEALIPGRFEIELEMSGRVLIELTVS
ncbi:MAG: hypothetical protein ACPHIC_02105 [Acidimicrobiales bacterium]